MTLMELIVSSALVLLLMGMVWMLLQLGSKFYLKVRAQSEIQTNALIALRWMSKDLAEGAPRSFRHYSPDSQTRSSINNGIVFGSPKDLDDKVSYSDSGRMLWSAINAYYIDSETNEFFRLKTPISEKTTIAPRIEDELYHIDLLASSTSSAGGEVRRRVIARMATELEIIQGVQEVEVVLTFRDESLGYGLTVRTMMEMKNR